MVRDAVEEDLALLRLVETVEDVHEGGFAGAVLAQEGVDLARLDGHIDVIVRRERPEALRDSTQLELHVLHLIRYVRTSGRGA